MARTYRKKRYFKKTKYAQNIQEIDTIQINAQPNSTFFQSYQLTTNPQQDANIPSRTFTVKNFAIDFYVDSADGNGNGVIEDICAYIMFVPQGMTVTDNYNLQHPEYILNYKYLGGPSNDTNQPYQPTRIRTRLARKLQTGDSIVLFIKGNNTAPSGATASAIYIHGLLRWWSKAN